MVASKQTYADSKRQPEEGEENIRTDKQRLMIQRISRVDSKTVRKEEEEKLTERDEAENIVF